MKQQHGALGGSQPLQRRPGWPWRAAPGLPGATSLLSSRSTGSGSRSPRLSSRRARAESEVVQAESRHHRSPGTPWATRRRPRGGASAATLPAPCPARARRLPACDRRARPAQAGGSSKEATVLLPTLARPPAVGRQRARPSDVVHVRSSLHGVQREGRDRTEGHREAAGRQRAAFGTVLHRRSGRPGAAVSRSSSRATSRARCPPPRPRSRIDVPRAAGGRTANRSPFSGNRIATETEDQPLHPGSRHPPPPCWRRSPGRAYGAGTRRGRTPRADSTTSCPGRAVASSSTLWGSPVPPPADGSRRATFCGERTNAVT